MPLVVSNFGDGRGRQEEGEKRSCQGPRDESSLDDPPGETIPPTRPQAIPALARQATAPSRNPNIRNPICAAPCHAWRCTSTTAHARCEDASGRSQPTRLAPRLTCWPGGGRAPGTKRGNHIPRLMPSRALRNITHPLGNRCTRQQTRVRQARFETAMDRSQRGRAHHKGGPLDDQSFDDPLAEPSLRQSDAPSFDARPSSTWPVAKCD